MIPAIITSIREYVDRNTDYERNGILVLEIRTGVWRRVIENLMEGKIDRYKIRTLNTLYDFFSLERDDFYMDNLDRLKQGTVHNQSAWHDSVFGSIMYEMRKKQKMTIPEVSFATKIDEKTIKRIEYGETLPSFGSYTLTTLANLYEFSDEDRNTIGWLITISKDTQKILKRIKTPMP